MPLKSFVVYIVDDDESICRALKRLVASVGYHQALTFGSAEDFLDTNLNLEDSCLVLDICLPKMTGLDLQEQLSIRGAKIPIIFITAHEDPQWQEGAMNRGAVAYLMKPFHEQALLNAINQCRQQTERGD